MRLESNQPGLANRSLVKPQPADDQFGNAKLDRVSDAFGAQGVWQDASHVATLASRGARVAAPAERLAPVAAKGLAGVARVLGKVGTVVSLPFLGYDVAKAIKEQDPEKKRAATANATLSVSSTALGAAGAMRVGGRAAVPLLLASGAVGALQLADTYVFDGKVTEHLGDLGARFYQKYKA